MPQPRPAFKIIASQFDYSAIEGESAFLRSSSAAKGVLKLRGPGADLAAEIFGILGDSATLVDGAI